MIQKIEHLGYDRVFVMNCSIDVDRISVSVFAPKSMKSLVSAWFRFR